MGRNTVLIVAPWSELQVRWLNQLQRLGFFHPFTCGWRESWHQDVEGVLFAREDGWHCPIDVCEYTQEWAFAWMANPEWWPQGPAEFKEYEEKFI